MAGDQSLSHLLRKSFSGYALRLSDIVKARAEAAFTPLELTPFAFFTLVCIQEGEGLSQQELSRHLNMYAQKMVGLLDDLEARGLIERRVSPSDRRRHSLALTALGASRVREASAVAAALEQDLFDAVTEEDKARFRALVERLEAR